jgi:RNA polymerase sigma-70 factor (ECF subfamily)
MTVPEFSPPCPAVGLRHSDATAPPQGRDKSATAAPAVGRSRLRIIIDHHYDFVWRTLRYLGVPDAQAEDAAQQVLCVLARRLDDVAEGAEIPFLFSTARRVASETRRAARRRPAASTNDVDALVDAIPGPDELLDERRAQAVLREVLDSIPVDLRVVFVLFEIEELTLKEVASLLDIPVGTVGSRLRRARETFRSAVQRMHGARSQGIRGDCK